MANFDVTFQARITRANPETIRLRVEELDNLQARLLGRADDLGSTFYDTATQFTDLIAWNISFRTREEMQVWQSAGTAIAYAASMMELWAQHVEDFQTERTNQTSEWFDFREAKKSEIPEKYQGHTITASHPEKEWGGFFGDANKCRSLYDDIVEKVDGLEKREKDNYQALENNAEEVAKMLGDGPTKENVQKLIDAGINSWAFYNLDPSNYTMMVDGQELTDEKAIEMADGLAPYWSGEKPIDENYHELMIMLSMITTNAMQAQQGGTGYREEEMDFLKAFYDALESGNPNPNSNGVLDIPVTMEGDHLSDEEREQALGVLGEGLLVLSDERLGGSYDDLPESVRSVIDGPDSSGIKSGGDYNNVHTNWFEKAESLEDLFAHTHQDMEGGAEFSTRMMETVTSQLQHVDALGKDDSSMSGLVDIATRNEDANYAILTGDYPEGVEGDLPWTDQNAQGIREKIIGNLYTHDWGDDGEAARGLTEWIDDYQNSDDPGEVDQGSEAFLALLNIITSPEMEEVLSGTGHSIEDEENDVTWENVSFTHLNPEIADSYVDLFLGNIEFMESVVGFNFKDGDGSNDESKSHSTYAVESEYLGDGKLVLDPMTRLAFAEYIVGSEDAAARLEAASFFRTEEAAFAYFSEYPSDVSEARKAGIFDALVEKAIDKEHQSRLDATNDVIDFRNQVTGNAADLVGAAFSEISLPGVGTVVEIAKQGFNEVLSMDNIDVTRDSSSDFSPIAFDNRATLHAAIAMEGVAGHTFGEGVDFLRNPDTGEISLDPYYWGSEETVNGDESFDADVYQDAIDAIYSELRDMKWPGAEYELGGSVVSEFSRFNSAGRQALDART